jgi:hypothetical protein
MRHGWRLLVLLALMTASVCGLGANAAPAPTPSTATPVVIGRSVVTLNGPWRFHTGDDPRWKEAGFDDGAWENLDLTAPPGAHDGDVGLKGYIPGWSAHGHKKYWGYAWYRMRLSVSGQDAGPLAVLGPAAVDGPYQVFLNGRLLGGGGGRLTGSRPVTLGNQPRLFAVPAALQAQLSSGEPAVLAIRVWSGSFNAVDPKGGGIHIAPALGQADAAEALYKLRWLDVFNGYIVDAAEAVVFLLLAAMTLSLRPFDRSNATYGWMAAALLFLGAMRANQAIFFWMQIESIQMFDLVRSVLLVPLFMGGWVMAWRAWFGVARPAWLGKAVIGLTLLYMLCQLFTRTTFSLGTPHGVAVWLRHLSDWIRLGLLGAMVWVVGAGAVKEGWRSWLAVLAAATLSVGLFAQELSALGLPGIWFPFGVGVSRTQYAYAVFAPLLFTLLLARLWRFAPGGEGGEAAAAGGVANKGV